MDEDFEVQPEVGEGPVGEVASPTPPPPVAAKVAAAPAGPKRPANPAGGIPTPPMDPAALRNSQRAQSAHAASIRLARLIRKHPFLEAELKGVEELERQVADLTQINAGLHENNGKLTELAESLQAALDAANAKVADLEGQLAKARKRSAA